MPVFRCIAAMIVLMIMTGCGYRFSGSTPGRLASGQSLWVSFIRIESDSPSVQTALRRTLQEECHARRGLIPSGDSESADLRLSGRLRSYSYRAMSYSAIDQVKEYRLTIEVELELYRKGEAVPFWKGILQGYQDYPANRDLSLQRSAEEAALIEASRSIAQKFMSAVEQVY